MQSWSLQYNDIEWDGKDQDGITQMILNDANDWNEASITINLNKPFQKSSICLLGRSKGYQHSKDTTSQCQWIDLIVCGLEQVDTVVNNNTITKYGQFEIGPEQSNLIGFETDNLPQSLSIILDEDSWFRFHGMSGELSQCINYNGLYNTQILDYDCKLPLDYNTYQIASKN